MDEMGFIEVETPMLTALDSGRRARLPRSERVHHGQFSPSRSRRKSSNRS